VISPGAIQDALDAGSDVVGVATIGTTASVVSIDRDAYALDRIGGRARRQRPGPLN